MTSSPCSPYKSVSFSFKNVKEGSEEHCLRQFTRTASFWDARDEARAVELQNLVSSRQRIDEIVESVQKTSDVSTMMLDYRESVRTANRAELLLDEQTKSYENHVKSAGVERENEQMRKTLERGRPLTITAKSGGPDDSRHALLTSLHSNRDILLRDISRIVLEENGVSHASCERIIRLSGRIKEFEKLLDEHMKMKETWLRELEAHNCSLRLCLAREKQKKKKKTSKCNPLPSLFKFK